MERADWWHHEKFNLQKRAALFKSWCNDFAQRKAAVKGLRLQADYRATLLRGVSAELEDENWQLSSATLAHGAIWGAGK